MALGTDALQDPPVLDDLSRVVRETGFEHFGFAELVQPLSIEFYEAWLANGHHGEMGYLERHLPQKKEPSALVPRARSAIVVTQDYVPHPAPLESWPLSKQTRVAAYAKGRDYHHFLSERLARLAERLKSRFPDHEFVCFTDSAPVLERDLAARAGLGWVGKNTCLIDRKKGSLFFIGEIYTTLALPVAKFESKDFCGTCTRCLDACPTGALKEPRVLDARLCISYLTIEARTPPAETLRAKMGDWFYGCDICQTVCPWNVKAHGKDALSRLEPDPSDRRALVDDLRFVLTSGNRALERSFQGTPLLRAGGTGLKRNALVVAGNKKVMELRGEIASLADHPKLGELAQWALAQMAND